MAGNGSGNGHGDSPKVPASVPPGAGTSAAAPPKKPIPEALERNKFKPGQSGNPKGRKPGTMLAASTIHEILKTHAPRDKRLSRLAKLVDIAIARAEKKGDWEGIRILANKWAPDQRIPDNPAANGASFEVNLNNYERMIAETEPQHGERPSFDTEN